jgi:hypothetical protein
MCDICGGQNGIGIIFSPNASTFPTHYQSTDAPQSFICQPGKKQTRWTEIPHIQSHTTTTE